MTSQIDVRQSCGRRVAVCFLSFPWAGTKLSSCCHVVVSVLWLFLTVMWVSLQCVLVTFLDLPFNQCEETHIIDKPRAKGWTIHVSKGAKIRNRYNQEPHLTQDTNGKVTNSQLDTTDESQEVSPFPAGDNKAHINRRTQRHSKHKTEQNKQDPQKKYRLYWRIRSIVR